MDSKTQPSLFALWNAPYNLFKGQVYVKNGSKQFKRQFETFMHLAFLNAQCALFRVDKDNLLIGTFSAESYDAYGNMSTGTFTPYNFFTNDKDIDRSIKINKSNIDRFADFRYGSFGIPMFVIISYYINWIKELFIFKKWNMRMSMVSTLVGAEQGETKLLQERLKYIFNIGNDMELCDLSPIKVLDCSSDKKGNIGLNITDLKDYIDLKIKFMGAEIMLDIDNMQIYMYKQIGIRSQILDKNDRTNKEEVNIASSIFDFFDNTLMQSFEKFVEIYNERNIDSEKLEIDLLVNKVKERDADLQNKGENNVSTVSGQMNGQG